MLTQEEKSQRGVQLVSQPIDRNWAFESVARPEAGAVATFEGVVRNHARGKRVTHLHYEAFSKMAIREMEKIRREALKRWPLEQVSIVHRVGRMEIGEASVLIAVSSAHRADAFEACRFLIDTLKTTVPIWKKEYYEDGECWVEEYSK